MPTTIEGIKLYTVAETAAALHVTAKTIRTWITNGRIKSMRIGRPIFITDQHLKDFMKESLK